MNRDPDSLKLEIDYWRQVLAIVDELNNGVADAAIALAEAPVALVTAAVYTRPAQRASIEAAMAACSETMTRLRALQPLVRDLIDLSTGRAKAIGDEIGGA